jgi:hypothetical protein
MVPGAALPPFTASMPESSEFCNNYKDGGNVSVS